MGEQSQHAILSPSAAKRWMACKPSARFEQQFPSEDSPYAIEGTLAHQVAEYILKERLLLQPKSDWLELVKINPLYTEEMHTHCEQYADYCMSLVHEDSIVYVETKVDIASHIPEGFGTNDFMCYTPSLKLLETVDLKYGKGVPVSAKENEQQKIYGIGGLNWFHWLFGEGIDRMRLNIYQPRINNNSAWEISVEELLKWGENELAPKAKLAFAGEGEYVPGEHCGFCKAKRECTARATYIMKLTEYELKDHNRLTDAELLDIFKKLPQLIAWGSDIGEHMLAEAVKGKKWDGMKLVEGKSNRVYVNTDYTLAKLAVAGFGVEILTTQELLGVTKLKTVIGAKAFKELVEPDLRKPAGKPTLVGEDDPRPDFDRAVAVFKNIEAPVEDN